MSTVIQVELGARSYPIHLVRELPGATAAAEARRVRGATTDTAQPALVVTDSHVGPLYGRHLVEALEGAGFAPRVFEIPAGEASKRLDTVAAALDAALVGGVGRRDLVLALGGGVVGDLAGFTAAVLHRGVPFLQVPTSLLAQVDSSVGGKTGVNHPAGKNLIGAFWQPRAVVASHAVLATLPERERRCGLAEAIKHGLIADADLVARCVAQAAPLRALAAAETTALVADCCRIKAAVVQSDEREAGRRALLNFGHTLGHAYERLLGYGALTHGEAIALGMVHAARLSEHLGAAPRGLADDVVGALTTLGLPVGVDDPGLPAPEELVQAARSDKKADGDRIRFVLLEAVGRARIRTLEWATLAEALRAQRADHDQRAQSR